MDGEVDGRGGGGMEWYGVRREGQEVRVALREIGHLMGWVAVGGSCEYFRLFGVLSIAGRRF